MGNGFVGGAVREFFNAPAFDVNAEKSPNTLAEVVACDLVFICVPTPNYDTGWQNPQNVCDALDLLYKAGYKGLALIKSTVLPGTCRVMAKMFPGIDIVSNPEFLRAASAVEDFRDPRLIVFGGEKDPVNRLESFFSIRFPGVPLFPGSWEEAELFKYVMNCGLALKVAYLNEIKRVCDRLKIDYEGLRWVIAADGRLGDSHLAVPGPDGQYGFGGACFPKDTLAFATWSQAEGVIMRTLTAALAVNDEVRDDPAPPQQ
jgi:UDPglucose 6-dehydrogenase